MFYPFVDNEVERIELEDGLWVDVRKSISFEEWQEASKDDLSLIVCGVKDWNFKDREGKPVPCTVENKKKMNSKLVSPLAHKCLKFYMPEKKTLMACMGESLEDILKEQEETS